MNNLFENIDLDDFFQFFPGALALVDSGLHIHVYNTSFVQKLGSPTGKNENLKDFISKKQHSAFFRAVQTFRDSSSRTCQLTIQFLKEDHSLRWGELYFAKMNPLLPEIFLVSIRDITRSRLQQLKLEEAKNAAEESSKSTMQMLANTSHELRTPIHTILGMTELLDDSIMDEEQQEYSSQIRFSADILLALINDILDYSKLEAGKVVLEEIEFPLIEMVESAVDMLTLEAHKKIVDIGIDIDSDIPEEIMGDPVRLRQIIVNLVNNAVKFTEKGEVIVSLKTCSVQEDTINIEFRVSDSGVGIPEEKQKNLFTAFEQADSSTTRKYGGTGLGLFISRSLVSQMGGYIGFESSPGKGTDFFFTLPMKKSPFIESESLIPRDFYKDIPILVVDDNRRIQDILFRYLSSWGCRVGRASSSSEALVELKRAAREGRPYSICLADQLMPGGDGWQLASEIHSDPLLLETRILLMLLKGKGAEEAKMMKLGWVHDYVKKPIRRETLLKKIFFVLNREWKEVEDAELIELPISEHDDLESAEPIKTDYNVLIAEDHITNQKLFKTILEKEDLLVSLANDGKEALERCQEQHFDLIFMDCQMPEMNGYLATEKIREMGIKTPIVAVTASAVQEEKERCLSCGMTDFLTKPFKRKDLIPFLKKYLYSREQGKAVPVEIEFGNKEEHDRDMLNNDPVFDYQDALHTFMGNKETLLGLLPPFLERTRVQIDGLEDLCKEKKPVLNEEEKETAVRLAHTIKGAAKNLSMLVLGKNAESVEDLLKQEDINYEKIEEEVVLLNENYKALKAEIESLMTQKS